MHYKTLLTAGMTALVLAGSAIAGEMKIMVKDAYARSTNPKVAAAFMDLMNHSSADDRLVSASSKAAKRVELHTHKETDGVMKMIHLEEGFALPEGEKTSLERGGKHVMLMGLVEPLSQGDTIEVTLTFEKAGEVTVTIPVDNERKAAKAAHGHKHGSHSNHGS